MQFSRRKFLDMALKASAMPAIPRSLLNVALGEVPIPVSPMAAIPLSAITPLIPASIIETVVNNLDDAWYGFGQELTQLAALLDSSCNALRQTITGHLNDRLPVLFRAVSQFRDVKAKLLTGDEERDGKTVGLIKAVTAIKRKLYTEELFRMAALCPSEKSYPNIDIDPDLSREDVIEMCGGEDEMMADLAWRASDVRMLFAGEDDEDEDEDDYGYEDDDDLEDFDGLRSAKIKIGSEIDYASLSPNDFCFAGVKSKFSDFMKAAKRAQFFNAAFEGAIQERQNGVYVVIQQLCQPEGICAETIHNLTNFVPDFIYDTDGRHLEDVEFYNLFDDPKLLKHTADIVSNQVNKLLGSFLEKHGLKLGADVRDYITNGLQSTVQGLYRQHFSSAIPDVLGFPKPEIDEKYLDLFQPAASEAEAGSTETTSATEEAPVAETASAETSADIVEIIPPQRLAAPILQRIATIEEAVEAVDGHDAEAAYPRANIADALEQLRGENFDVAPMAAAYVSAQP